MFEFKYELYKTEILVMPSTYQVNITEQMKYTYE